MRPAQLTNQEWGLLLPSQRDLVRLEILNYTPPNDYSQALETEGGLKIAIAREQVAALMEERFNNFAQAMSHKQKVLEMTRTLEEIGTKTPRVEKRSCHTKKCLTSYLWEAINKVVRNMKRTHRK
jgi:hypothetical protein